MPVRTVRKKDIPKLVSGVAKSTSTHLESMLSGQHKFFFENRAVQCQPIDALRWFTETIPESSKTLHIRNIMVNAVNDSESTQGSSAVVCAAALTSILSLTQMCGFRDVLDDLSRISALSRRSSSNQILDIMKSLDNDPMSYALARTAILGCSSNASIQVSKGEKTSSAKSVRGYKFPLVTPSGFSPSVGTSVEKSLTSSKSLVVDGFIESVSEIDGVIRSSYETKTPLLIVARGFSPEVINTLVVNYSHGHLKVIPMTVPFDELGVNLINDIAIVLRSEIVSSTKGEIISSRKWDDLGTSAMVRVNFSTGITTVIDDSVKDLVARQRKHLRDRRKSADSDGQRDLFDRRLACLMGEGVLIELGSDLKDLTGIYTDRLNAHIRNYRTGAKFGIIRIDDCLKHVKSNTTVRILKQLQKLSEAYTTLSLLVGIRNAVICANQMTQIGGIIYNDRR